MHKVLDRIPFAFFEIRFDLRQRFTAAPGKVEQTTSGRTT